MTYGILLEFDDSVGQKQYDAVNEQLGLDPAKGTRGSWVFTQKKGVTCSRSRRNWWRWGS